MGVNVKIFGAEPSPIWAPDNPRCICGDHVRVTQVAILSGQKVTELHHNPYKFWRGMRCSFISSFGRTADKRGNEVSAHVDPGVFAGQVLSRRKKNATPLIYFFCLRIQNIGGRNGHFQSP
jgi:hypothetical protein